MGLAEPKRKVKYSIDPNAQHWSKNESKFGARLMKKMGWEEGKGLGANEDGMTEHIKVRFKDDTKGVGYTKNDYDDVWMDHQDNFEDLLKNLKNAAASDSDHNNSSGEEVTTKAVLNLEEAKAKTSHLRHLKLIKAKNLSKATNNDLDCILGTKKRKAKKQAEEEPAPPNVVNKMENESESESERRVCFKQTEQDTPAAAGANKPLTDSMSSVFTTNTQSIGDYFKTKMKAKLNPQPQEDEPESEKKKSKKSKKSKREEPVEGTPVQDEEAEPEVKKKKLHKKPSNDSGGDTPEYFAGSNLFEINGYTPYVITASTNALINERLKKAKVKQAAYQKNVEKDKNFYAMSKKSKLLE